MEKFSFVIPCYNSELTINNVLDEIHSVMSQRPEYDYEIICVNDCSPDNVLEVLTKRADSDERLIVADLAKNTKKMGAVLAGYSLVSGDYVVDLDDDGQCPLDRLWDLFAAIENGNDVVYAGYNKKKQSRLKNFGSRINDLMAHRLIGKPKGLRTSNFSVERRIIIDELKRYKSYYPYPGGFIFLATSKIADVPMEERERELGRSNFNFRISLSVWINGFMAYSVVPLRVFSFIGMLTALSGFIYGLSVVIRRLFIIPNMPLGYPSIMAALLFVGGVIMLMLGMLGEYVGRTYINQNNLPQYIIRDVVGGEKQNDNHSCDMGKT